MDSWGIFPAEFDFIESAAVLAELAELHFTEEEELGLFIYTEWLVLLLAVKFWKVETQERGEGEGEELDLVNTCVIQTKAVSMVNKAVLT